MAGNAITEKIQTVSTKEKTRFPWFEGLRIVCWLTPTAEYCIMATGCAIRVPESMARISMAAYIRAYTQSLADKYYGDEWLRLCG
jgi:hypothetical protein